MAKERRRDGDRSLQLALEFRTAAPELSLEARVVAIPSITLHEFASFIEQHRVVSVSFRDSHTVAERKVQVKVSSSAITATTRPKFFRLGGQIVTRLHNDATGEDPEVSVYEAVGQVATDIHNYWTALHSHK
ncbi:hypothetical protein KA012_03075 [Candidatus Woesebacteria bacterium]|nr:hypothetical protein [Candidatus Woesebacteria bacterium]